MVSSVEPLVETKLPTPDLTGPVAVCVAAQVPLVFDRLTVLLTVSASAVSVPVFGNPVPVASSAMAT